MVFRFITETSVSFDVKRCMIVLSFFYSFDSIRDWKDFLGKGLPQHVSEDVKKSKDCFEICLLLHIRLNNGLDV